MMNPSVARHAATNTSSIEASTDGRGPEDMARICTISRRNLVRYAG
jgi:hypothetical protein